MNDTTNTKLSKADIMKACSIITNDLGYADVRNETIEANGDYDAINKIETISSYNSVEEFSDELYNEIVTDEVMCIQLSSYLD